MWRNNFLKRKTNPNGQSMVEFAIVLPVLMLVVVGLIEAGRLLFIYSSVTTATRAAVRYGSATGQAVDESGNPLTDGGGTAIPRYQHCAGIRDAAQAMGFLSPLADEDIEIAYDHGPDSTTPYDFCDGEFDTNVEVENGDRITVTIDYEYSPAVPITPIQPFPINAQSSRTFLVSIAIADTEPEEPPVVTCYTLSLGHSGNGTNPTASPGNSTGCSAGQYKAGESITLGGATPDAGWVIGSWYGTSSSSSPTLSMPASDHSAGVTYISCNLLTITRSGEGSTPTASPANSTGCSAGYYTAGELITLSGAAPAVNWQISSWPGTNQAESTAASNTVTMPNSATSAGVVYTPLCNALTINYSGQGVKPTASPANSAGCETGKYLKNTIITLSNALPSTGWVVSSWTGTTNNTSTATTNTINMPSGPHTASVIYAQCNALTLGRNPTEGGGIPTASISAYACEAGKYISGESITLQASPNAGYVVGSWYGTTNSSTNIVSMPNSAHSAGVNYLQCYPLTLSHDGQGSNPVASPANSPGCAAGQYYANATINLSGASPMTGWQISSWSGTQNNASTGDTNTVTMPASAHTAKVIYTELFVCDPRSTTMKTSPFGLTIFNYSTNGQPITIKSITIYWRQSPSSQKLNGIKLGGVTIKSPNTKTTPYTATDFSGDVSIPAGGESRQLTVTFSTTYSPFTPSQEYIIVEFVDSTCPSLHATTTTTNRPPP